MLALLCASEAQKGVSFFICKIANNMALIDISVTFIQNNTWEELSTLLGTQMYQQNVLLAQVTVTVIMKGLPA